jgi:parvulin-like peptidyl-prolyl isomerase
MRVMAMRLCFFLLSPALLLLLSVSCSRQGAARPEPSDAVAVIGDRVITVEAFQKEVMQRGLMARGKHAKAPEKQALLQELIRVEAMHQKALAAGYDKDPEIVASLKRMIVAKFEEDQLVGMPQPLVNPEEIASYYQQHLDRFRSPEKARVALIELKVARTAAPGKRADLARRAAAIRAEAVAAASDDGTFGARAQTWSEAQASRYRGGEIGWVTAGATNTTWPKPVIEAMFQLSNPGDLSPVIETPTAFYLVKLMEKQPAKQRPLEDVREGIQYLVAREKEQQRREALWTRAQQGLPIRINQDLLNSISWPARTVPPPVLPGLAARQPQPTP